VEVLESRAVSLLIHVWAQATKCETV